MDFSEEIYSSEIEHHLTLFGWPPLHSVSYSLLVSAIAWGAILHRFTKKLTWSALCSASCRNKKSYCQKGYWVTNDGIRAWLAYHLSLRLVYFLRFGDLLSYSKTSYPAGQSLAYEKSLKLKLVAPAVAVRQQQWLKHDFDDFVHFLTKNSPEKKFHSCGAADDRPAFDETPGGFTP